MSRAEEQALKAYPNIKIGEQRLDQSSAREVYVEGYNQASKDLMDKAVDGEVNIWGSHISLPKVLPSEFSKQKVKIIIIKD